MARSSAVASAGRSLVWLLVIVLVLLGLNTAAVLWENGRWTPALALDLEGGTQLILAPQVGDGEQVTQQQLDQAVGIIRQRIDSSGVSEAEITTQGGQNVVVAIPGEPDEATLDRIRSSAKMELRAVLAVAMFDPAAVPTETSSAGPTDPALTDPAASGEADPAASDPAASDEATAPVGTEEPAAPAPTDPSDLAQITPEIQAQFDALDCQNLDQTNVAPADEPLVTCSADGTIRYILGPVEVDGSNIQDASFGAQTSSQGTPTGQWIVNIEFDAEGADAFHEVTSRITSLQAPNDQFAFVLDGTVLLAPESTVVITDGKATISGNFTQDEAQSLADQLKFGALPISFVVQSEETISATLGSSQLASGLLAGLIGLILVVIYSIFQYRALAFVTILSLMVAAGITYLVVTYLSSTEGYRLSLAGVAGLIVAIGITADSFIVYFERVRDELRDGRSLTSAVEHGWKRALRTILASDTVNFLAALVLFFLAVGNVRGFALTLGITTIIDLVVVILFTHPMLQVLSRTRFFSEGRPASGLDPKALGAVYRGRATFKTPTTNRKSSGEAQRRQTLAERKREAELESAGRRGTSRSKGGED